MPNKITGKIIGKITGKITGKNFTNRGSFKSRFAGSVIGSVKGLFAGSVMGVFLVGLLFSLVAGVGNLQAQERQQGWFVGVSPFVMDVKLKKTSRRIGNVSELISESETELVTTDVMVVNSTTIDTSKIDYDATVPNFNKNNTTTFRRFGTLATNRPAAAELAGDDAILVCKGTPRVPAANTNLTNISYDATDNLTDDLRQLLMDTPATNRGSDCENLFDSEFSNSRSEMTTTSDGPTENPPDRTTYTPTEKTTEETSKLKGTGISFGFNFEKYSLSFNQLQWSAGDDKLQAQVLLARYFLPYGFSVGGGLASAKLGTSFGSASGTAPALHFAYNYPVTKNLQIQVGLFWLGLDLAVQDTQIITPTTTTTTTISDPYNMDSTTISLANRTSTPTSSPITKRAIMGINHSGNVPGKYQAFYTSTYDTRVVVTATLPSGTDTTTSSTTSTTITKSTTKATNTTNTVTGEHHQTAEIKNPATISINFIWRFR